MLKLPVRVVKRKRIRQGREYEWVERRINLPSDFPDVSEVIILTPEEYARSAQAKRGAPSPELLDFVESALKLVAMSEVPWPRLKWERELHL